MRLLIYAPNLLLTIGKTLAGAAGLVLTAIGMPPSKRIPSFGTLIADWIAAAADHYAAAILYEQMSGLCDAELRRRGLSRDTLARDICAASMRNATNCRDQRRKRLARGGSRHAFR